MRRLKTLSAHSIQSQRPKFSSQSLCFHALSEYLNDFILHIIKVVSINIGIFLLSAIKYNIHIFFQKDDIATIIWTIYVWIKGFS